MHFNWQLLTLIACALLASLVTAGPQRQPGRNNFFPQQQPDGNNFFSQQQQQQQQQRPFGQGGGRRPGGNRPPTTSNGNGGGGVTAAPAPAVTTASPQYLACLQSCPTTMEYNPVCGTDNINYHNNARLDCAVRCGKNVAAVRSGTCAAL